MKRSICILVVLLCLATVFASEIEASIVISGVAPGGGDVYVQMFNSEDSYKKGESFRSWVAEPSGTTVTLSSLMPAGDYYVMIFQDTNGNGELDTKLFGIPREPVGISNFNGRSMPGGFNKHKMRVDAVNPVIPVQLHRL